MNIKKILPIIGIIILIYLLTILDFTALKELFLNIPPLYAFLCLFSVIPIVISTNIQWQILLKKQKMPVSFSYSLKNILEKLRIFLSIFLPIQEITLLGSYGIGKYCVTKKYLLLLDFFYHRNDY